MGNGGPLCALAGVGNTSKSTTRSPTETPPALVRRFGIVNKPTAAIRSSAWHAFPWAETSTIATHTREPGKPPPREGMLAAVYPGNRLPPNCRSQRGNRQIRAAGIRPRLLARHLLALPSGSNGAL